MPYFDRDVAIVMLTDVARFLSIVFSIFTPNFAPLGVQLVGYRLHPAP